MDLFDQRQKGTMLVSLLLFGKGYSEHQHKGLNLLAPTEAITTRQDVVYDSDKSNPQLS